VWTDFNSDGKIDLIIVGEFMPVSFYKNNGSSFEKITSGIDNYKGWFNSITGGDYDNDGDTDYLVGNLGLNNYYNASFTQPVTVCAKDFDNNGSVDAILSCYVRAEDGTMKSYPVHFWDDLNSQSPKFRRKFSQYKDFAKVSTDQFFTPEELKESITMEANYMATSYVENIGSGKFKMHQLPILVQVAPVNGMIPFDVNDDGNLDVLMVGNDYGNEPTVGQNDAFTGLVLLGDGKGNFNVISSVKSGFNVHGDAKGLARLAGVQGELFIATQNRDSIKVFTPSLPERRFEFRPEPDDSWAELSYTDGRKQKVEFYFGSGYLSQSTRRLRISRNVKEIVVYDYKGKSRKIVPTGI
jgi:enediyne biosynthesis protein E4